MPRALHLQIVEALDRIDTVTGGTVKGDAQSSAVLWFLIGRHCSPSEFAALADRIHGAEVGAMLRSFYEQVHGVPCAAAGSRLDS